VDFGTLLLDLALLAVVAYLIARPLLRPAHTRDAQPSAADALIAERERLLAALRDLELDHATGVVAAQDYGPQRAQLVARGAAVLRELDALAAKPRGQAAQRRRSVEDEIEAAVSQRRQGRRGAASRPVEAQPAAACPACGQAPKPGDRFCAHCGSTLEAVCGECGQPLSAHEAFCAACGTRAATPAAQGAQREPVR
jgi:hypothetical protein